MHNYHVFSRILHCKLRLRLRLRNGLTGMLYEAYELKSHAFVKQHVTTPIGAIYHFSKLHQTSLMAWLNMRGKQAAYNALELIWLAQQVDLLGYAWTCAMWGLGFLRMREEQHSAIPNMSKLDCKHMWYLTPLLTPDLWYDSFQPNSSVIFLEPSHLLCVL